MNTYLLLKTLHILSSVLLVGTGTRIAPLMGLMQELQANACEREVHLVFGEKHRQHDYLYRDQLQDWHARGVLAGLHTAFSRDGAEKIYVQHVLQQRDVPPWQRERLPLLSDPDGTLLAAGDRPAGPRTRMSGARTLLRMKAGSSRPCHFCSTFCDGAR